MVVVSERPESNRTTDRPDRAVTTNRRAYDVHSQRAGQSSSQLWALKMNIWQGTKPDTSHFYASYKSVSLYYLLNTKGGGGPSPSRRSSENVKHAALSSGVLPAPSHSVQHESCFSGASHLKLLAQGLSFNPLGTLLPGLNGHRVHT